VAIEAPVLVYMISGRARCSASVSRSGVKARSSGERGSELMVSWEEFECDVCVGDDGVVCLSFSCPIRELGILNGCAEGLGSGKFSFSGSLKGVIL